MTSDIPAMKAVECATGFSFLEGPRWRDGALYASDFYSGRVVRFTPGVGSHTVEDVTRLAGRPSGLGFAPDGSLWIVSMLARAVVRWNGVRLDTVASFGHLVSGYANDMIVFDSGWALVGSFGNSDADPDSLVSTGLVRVSPTGEVDLVASGLVFPNGMVQTDDAELVVAETFAGRLVAFALTFEPSGKPVLGSRRVWKQFGSAPDYLDIARATVELPALPDGLALDTSGAIWVASSNGHLAMRVAPDGRVLETVDVAPLAPYALALGGVDGRTLYLCCSPVLGAIDPSTTTESVLMAATVTVAAARSAGPIERTLL